MSLKKVRLELARDPEFPEGSSHHGYEFNVPLTEDGHISKKEWMEHAADCTVRRFWGDEEDEHGRLVLVGDRWLFHYSDSDPEEDESIFRMSSHVFVPGEYITITEHDGEMRTFKIVSVRPSPLG